MADKTFDWLNPFASIDLGIASWADGIKQWAISNRDLIQPTKRFFETVITGIESALHAVPPLVMLVVLVLLAWQTAGRRAAIRGSGVAASGVGLMEPKASASVTP